MRALLWLWLPVLVAGFTRVPPSPCRTTLRATNDREAEIRRKIAQLKKKTTDPSGSSYDQKIRQKLGKTKSRMLGYTGGVDEEEDDFEEDDAMDLPEATIGALEDSAKRTFIDPSLLPDEEPDVDEESLVEQVEAKLLERRRRELEQKEANRDEAIAKAKLASQQLTSGIGGSWQAPEKNETEYYQPKSGSWGAFPRPKDISKTYGGGRRIVPPTEEERQKSADETRERLRRYREKVGIDVASEKEHAGDIEEAMAIGKRAMQRGMYTTAVSALEKVTQYCSSNSPVGSKVFLELAMAYEAAGRSREAATIYTTLTKCRMEEVQYNAKRLLYGLEAMQFMRDDLRRSEFSRSKAKSVFIDTTGLANIASNFDDRYETAYIDTSGNFYKRLTESVVRSPREARQILLKATDAGEVERTRIVQALRSLSRQFDDALEEELAKNVVPEPVAVIDGKPIYATPEPGIASTYTPDIDGFILYQADEMFENLNGEWKLQLLADKRGDGVKFFNTTIAWQKLDMNGKEFESSSSVTFGTIEQSGGLEFNGKRRILRRQRVETTGSMLSSMFGTTTGAPGAIRVPQQVVTVDSVLLITRGVPSRIRRQANKDDEKEYFAVWRRVDPGTFSSS